MNFSVGSALRSAQELTVGIKVSGSGLVPNLRHAITEERVCT